MFKFSNISYKVKNKEILDDVTINIPRNKLTVLLGQSGAGKSTLFKLISGRLPSKNIKLNNKVISDKILRNNTAFVYQHHCLPEELTVNECFIFCYNCKSKSTNTKKMQKDIDYMLESLDIFDIKNRRIGTSGSNLSGGQLKRIELGLELMFNPDILFVDEPFSGLDSYNSLKIIEKMKSLEKTIIVTVHQPSNSILQYVDHIIILHQSGIFFEGTSDELTKYIHAIGYENIRDQVSNSCEYVFISVFPDMKKRNLEQPDFLYKNNHESKDTFHLQQFSETINIFAEIKLFFKQILAIFKRSFIQFYRNYKYGLMRSLQSIVSVFLVLLIFGNLESLIKCPIPTIRDEMQFSPVFQQYKRQEYVMGLYLIFFIMLGSFIQNSMAGSNIFSRNFQLLQKENSNNYFSIPAYCISTTIFEYLISLVITIVPYIIGLLFVKTNFGKPFKFAIILGLIPCSLISLSFMMLFSAYFYDTQISYMLYATYNILILATSGFFSDNSGLLLTRIVEKVNPLRFGICLAIKYWIDGKIYIRYILRNTFIRDSYHGLFSIISIVLIFCLILTIYSGFFILLLLWKI